jgi:heptosyltransferase I
VIELQKFFSEPPESVCLLRLSALGDVCNTLPVVRAIQDHWPNTSITWVIGKAVYPLVQEETGIDFILIDKTKSFFYHRKQLAKRSFTVLLNLHPTMRANLVSCVINAEIKIGFDKERSKDFHYWFCPHSIKHRPREHVVDGFLGFLSALGFPAVSPRWDLKVPESILGSEPDHLSPHKLNILISPCSGERRNNYRNWKVERYIDLINQINHNFKANIIVTGGNSMSDQIYCRALNKSNIKVKNLMGKSSIPELIRLISLCDLVICPDSGPAHIANALGVPVVTLFGTSNKNRTGPYQYLDYAVDCYESNLNKYLNRSVHEVRWGHRIRVKEAMDSILVSDVIEKIQGYVENRKS